MPKYQIFKQEEARPVAVEMYNTPRSDIIPTYPQLEEDRTFWEKLPGLRANDTGEVVIDGRTITGSSMRDVLDFVHKGKPAKPYGMDQITDYLESQGMHNILENMKPTRKGSENQEKEFDKQEPENEEPDQKTPERNYASRRMSRKRLKDSMRRIPSTPSVKIARVRRPAVLFTPEFRPPSLEIPVTPMRSIKKRKPNPTYFPRSLSRPRPQRGTGKRMYIRLWK